MAQHDHRTGARYAVFLLSEHTALCRSHAEQVEIVPRHQVAPDAFVVSRSAQAHRRETVHRHPVEHVVSVAKVHVQGVGERREGGVLPHQVDVEDPLRLRHRQRTEQHRVDQAEDGRVRPDAERQRQDRDGGETRPLDQHSDRVAQVSGDRFNPGQSALVAI